MTQMRIGLSWFFLWEITHKQPYLRCISSNNPLDEWNVYMLTGDVLGTDHWTDYPAISLTNDELFITGNLLQHNVSWQEGFYQSLIWQQINSRISR